jgi:circadian clock protein KaiC
MKKRTTVLRPGLGQLSKTPTGIPGLDEVTNGGLPQGRPTLVCGSAGAGKTLLAVEFLVRGATQFREPGVLMMFEETAEEISQNVRSLGFDLDKLVREKKLLLDHVRIERSEIQETGEYDLDGLFIRLGLAVDTIGAKRVVLDTLEALFAGLPNHAIVRAELRRLFRWLKQRGLTAIVTGERGESSLTRYGLEEYVADCVIVLDHRVADQVSTRRLRVVKYRGSVHGGNEYPFLIGERGISLLPVTSLRLDHRAMSSRVSTGIAGLDGMLGGRGVFRGSSTLISGAPGTGKSSLGAAFVDAACRRGERALIFAFEESPGQILRNMRSIGIDLRPWTEKGLLEIHASRPSVQGLEQHLLLMHDLVLQFKPSVVLVDPITSFVPNEAVLQVKPMLMRLIDFLKQQGVTTIFSSLTASSSREAFEDSEVAVSSLMDTWLLVRNLETNGERNRTLYVLKSRGMAHSHQVREFLLSSRGIQLLDVYSGGGSALTGAARAAQGARDRAEASRAASEYERRLRQFAVNRQRIEAQIAALRAELESEAAEMENAVEGETARRRAVVRDAREMASLRGGHHAQSQPGKSA